MNYDNDETIIAPMINIGISTGTLLLGTYTVERALAAGGMATTYLTHHKELNNTKHVIKVIKSEFTSNLADAFELTNSEASVKSIALLKHEAEALLSIHHDAVVGYQGFQKDAVHGHCLIMEYVAGPSLKDFLKQHTLTIAQYWQLRNRLAGGLAAAHAKGIFHRDISPDNVILPDGKIEDAKLIDFGIAKQQKPASDATVFGSMFVGKYAYAAPEQFEGGTVGAYSDLYSLGLVLAEAVIGKRLDMGSTEESAKMARRSLPDLKNIPVVLKPQFSAMLQPKPSDRLQSMLALLERWPDPANEKRLGAVSKAAWAVGLIVVALVVGVGVWQFMPRANVVKPVETIEQGYLSFDSTPEGALVLANDSQTFIGITPIRHAYIPAGNNSLSIRKMGYRDEKLLMEIHSREEKSENIALQPLDSTDDL